MSAVFTLTNEKGNYVEGAPKVGNYFKIDILGPGTASGDGYDWVRVEAVEENQDEEDDIESISIRVRPADNPTNNDNNVAHFFSGKATPVILLFREKRIQLLLQYMEEMKCQTRLQIKHWTKQEMLW